jgi:hypothetical protein
VKSLISIFTNYTDVVPRKTVNGEQYTHVCQRQSFFIIFGFFLGFFPSKFYFIGCEYCVLIRDDKILFSTLFLCMTLSLYSVSDFRECKQYPLNKMIKMFVNNSSIIPHNTPSKQLIITMYF